MKQVCMFILAILFVLSVSVVRAEEKAPLGSGTFALKIDYIKFNATQIRNSNVDTGLYLGIEGYGHIGSNWYLGGEVGYANPQGSFTYMGTPYDAELTFIPVEVNVKRALARSPHYVTSSGFGLSLNFVEQKTRASGPPLTTDDILWGFQFFFDYNYKINNFFVGATFKFQVTDKFSDESYNYFNWRLGSQVGFMF